MASKAELHSELDRLVPQGLRRRDLIRIAGHALIELGLIETMECSYPECPADSREFTPVEDGPRNPTSPSLDHVIPVFMGGTDMPDNLQLMHFGCNAAKGGKEGWSDPKIRARLSAHTKARWEDPKYRAVMAAAGSSVAKSAAQSEGMKRYWSNPDVRKKRGDAQRGDNHWRAKRRAEDMNGAV